jgi:hypothetical protein
MILTRRVGALKPFPQHFLRGDMRATCALALVSLFLLLGTPLCAESLCGKCLTAAQKELRKCLDAAISQQDKKSCLIKQEVKSKTCEEGECKIEQAVEAGNKSEVAAQKDPEEK